MCVCYGSTGRRTRVCVTRLTWGRCRVSGHRPLDHVVRMRAAHCTLTCSHLGGGLSVRPVCEISRYDTGMG
eukprot:4198047-Prymnesium_polylepis.1